MHGVLTEVQDRPYMQSGTAECGAPVAPYNIPAADLTPSLQFPRQRIRPLRDAARAEAYHVITGSRMSLISFAKCAGWSNVATRVYPRAQGVGHNKLSTSIKTSARDAFLPR